MVDGTHYLAIDWLKGRLLRLSRQGDGRELLTGFHQLADPGYNSYRNEIALLVMSENRLIFLRFDALADYQPRLRPLPGSSDAGAVAADEADHPNCQLPCSGEDGCLQSIRGDSCCPDSALAVIDLTVNF